MPSISIGLLKTFHQRYYVRSTILRHVSQVSLCPNMSVIGMLESLLAFILIPTCSVAQATSSDEEGGLVVRKIYLPLADVQVVDTSSVVTR